MRAAGADFATLLRERIFRPLDMQNTVAFEAGKSVVANRAFGYSAVESSWTRTDQSPTSATLGGFRILVRRCYVPTLSLETIRFITDRQHLTVGGQLRKVITNSMLPRLTAPLWSRFYYAHYAVLCTKTGA